MRHLVLLLIVCLVTLDGCSSCQSHTLALTVAGNLADGYTVSDGDAGGRGAFTCDAPPGLAPKPRLVCRRGGETLDLLFKDDGAVVVEGATPHDNEKRFYRCTGSETALACEPVAVQRKAPDGKFLSPFHSTVEGLSIHNAHVVQNGADGAPLVLRGMTPLTDDETRQLARLGVKSVLIYKVTDEATAASDGKPNEITAERQRLTAAGFAEGDVVTVPMPWRHLSGFAEPCRETVKALQTLQSNAAAGRKTYFHCTVGEDRTGMLAALYRMLNEPLSPRLAFFQEMCEHGYASGDPEKPYDDVSEAIDRELTPVYLKLAELIESGKLTRTSLDPAVCDTEPPAPSADEVAAYRCPTSSLFDL